MCEEMEAPFFTPGPPRGLAFAACGLALTPALLAVDIDFPMDAFGESTRGDLRFLPPPARCDACNSAPPRAPLEADTPLRARLRSPSKAFKGTELTDEEVSSWQQVLDMDRYAPLSSVTALWTGTKAHYCSGQQVQLSS